MQLFTPNHTQYHFGSLWQCLSLIGFVFALFEELALFVLPIGAFPILVLDPALDFEPGPTLLLRNRLANVFICSLTLTVTYLIIYSTMCHDIH